MTNNNADNNFTTIHEVSHVIYYPEYEPSNFWKNDIAILRVCDYV